MCFPNILDPFIVDQSSLDKMIGKSSMVHCLDHSRSLRGTT